MTKRSQAPLHIGINLDEDFVNQFNKMRTKYGSEMTHINGFDDARLSYTDFISNYIDKGVVADKSVDPSANVSHKDIVVLDREMTKPHSKLLSFNKIYYEMIKQYGFQAANEWLEKEWDGHLYMHDAISSSKKPYCFAFSLKGLAERGLFFDDNSGKMPAEHLIVFVDFIKEFVRFAANLQAGAVGMPDLLIYMYYFWKKDIKDNYYVRNPEYYAKQNFQRFIYAVNQSAIRDGVESSYL